MLSLDVMVNLAGLFMLAGTFTMLLGLGRGTFYRAAVPLQRTVRTLTSLGLFCLSGFFALNALRDQSISVAAAPLLGEVFWALGIVSLAGGIVSSTFMFALSLAPRQTPLLPPEPPHDV
jgi:hypothetical protein